MSPWMRKPMLQRRMSAAFVAIAVLVFIGTIIRLRPTPQLRILALRAGIAKDSASDQLVYEVEGVALGAPFADEGIIGAEDVHLEALKEALRLRFAATIEVADEPPRYPNCTLRPERYTKAIPLFQQSGMRWQIGRAHV